jgi:hypothetical protein
MAQFSIEHFQTPNLTGPTLNDWSQLIINQQASWGNMLLLDIASLNTSDAPTIGVGSRIEINGSMFTNTESQTPTGTLSNGQMYVYACPDGAGGMDLKYDNSGYAPVWSAAKGGWFGIATSQDYVRYNGNRCILKFYYDGTNYNGKVVLHNETDLNRTNTDQEVSGTPALVQTFTYTGAEQTYDLDPGIYEVHIVGGGSGGGGGGIGNSGGGKGAAGSGINISGNTFWKNAGQSNGGLPSSIGGAGTVGGGGGGGASSAEKLVDFNVLMPTEIVCYVGAGGAGGTQGVVPHIQGWDGNAGEDSYVVLYGSILIASKGGKAGSAGSNAAALIGGAGASTDWDGANAEAGHGNSIGTGGGAGGTGYGSGGGGGGGDASYAGNGGAGAPGCIAIYKYR